MDNPAIWAGIYLAIAAAFGIGEILMPGSFFLLPFAAGGVAAAVASLLGAPVVASLPVFLVISFVTFLGMRPLARRMEADTPDVTGIGSNRLVGGTGTVLRTISAEPGEAGLVRVNTEEWRADAANEISIPAGTRIRVVAVRGTRLVVEQTDATELPGLPELG
jgi:membrane protein implicated in regulation of membrane protease activity